MKIAKKVFLLVLALAVLALIPVFLKNNQPVFVEVPEINVEEIQAKQEAQQKAAQEAMRRAKQRRMVACETDDECVIVDKDACGCLIGPKSVTAINISAMMEFNNMHKKSGAAKCPNREPSNEAECSITAHAACVNKACKILY